MTLRFGTDGVRGVANAELTPELVLRLGRAASRVLRGETFYVGRDTRISGPMLQAALTAGLGAEGAAVVDLGVLPTPGVAWLSAADGVPAAMISASHNTFADNGIKFFAAGGRKLPDDVEERLEAELDRLAHPELGVDDPRIGRDLRPIRSAAADAVARYSDALVRSLEGRRLDGLHVVVDCAHGAASDVAPAVLRRLGAEVEVIHAQPDGVNINAGCGSTHPESLQRSVVALGADAGLAFDGDADRVLAVDASGELVDGDQLIAICALDLRARGRLKDDTVVVTVMTNLGFHLAMAEHGVRVEQTAVGDRYVLEALARGGWSLGGEQSGHVIFSELLRGVAGIRALLADDALAPAIADRLAELTRRVRAREADLDAAALRTDVDVEAANAELVRLKDAEWAIRSDRLRTADAVKELAGGDHAPGPAAIAAYLSIQIALSAIDRLEVRGRDSAGIHVLVTGHGLDLDSDEVRRQLDERSDPLFTSGAVRTPEGHLAFVYKAAAEIGELGDNTNALRRAIVGDDLLRRAVDSSDTTEATVLGHTRWASVGIISEPNAHPLDSLEEGRTNPYAAAALNGDVDNHAALVEAHGLCIPSAVTTDAKVIPTLVARRRDDGADLVDAFRGSVATFDGSVAIALNAAEQPGTLLLAQRGSGQSLYVGIADDAYVVASEPYGLVEQTRCYVRMDGETPSGADGTSGQIVVVSPDGLRRYAYDGTELPVTDTDVVTADITTRDIDRGGAPHFLLKEIGESPQSVRKTLRGKIVEDGGRLAVALPGDALPESVRARLGDGTLRRVLVIGQGTAAVAGQSLAAFLEDEFAGSTRNATALPATELSGFSLTDDMSDTLVVAISQSGTTTDTNRTVDLVRARGAAVLAIVNRRNSDLVERADGVLYTSDGRDVEMSVASTKAFYAQIAAGVLLALAISEAAGCADRSRTSDLLAGLRALPDAMEGVLQRREVIAAAAQEFAPPRRYWAMVGNGRNRIAAQELRIKLSELCYKSIAADATEDKKHIDLSSEPMILVCAAGLSGATADDVAKEVAIYRAHKAAPIVIATEGGHRFSSALAVIDVPPVHPALAFVVSAMAGHLFGYEAALAIDAQARQLREIRAAVEDAVTQRLEGDALLRHLDRALDGPVAAWFRTLRSGALNGHLEAATAVRLASLFGYATGLVPVDAYEVEYGRAGTPEAVVNDLLDALNDAVDELTRPIDAIKHQAKTVTVGISRSEEAYFDSRLVREVLTAGAGRDRLSYRALRSLAELDPAIESVTGWTRYAVEGDVADHTATATIVDRGGIAREIASRTDRDPRLTGTKHRAAFEREVTVAVGRRDDRPIVIVPETKDNQVTGLTLLHAKFRDRLPADVARRVLSGYRGRYQALVDAVTETEPSFDDAVLAEVPILDLLSEPVYVLASHWRA